jgi:single-strand DNA-binding protein
MGTVNRVIIMGNLGADPELRQTPAGQAVTTLSVATTRAYTDRDGLEQKTTEWHRVVVWGKQAENCAHYLSKGRGVFVEGRLATRSWEDRNGEKRYATEIVASNVQFLGGPHGPEGSGRHAGPDVAAGHDGEPATERAAQPSGGPADERHVWRGAAVQSTSEAVGGDVAVVTPPARRDAGRPQMARMSMRPRDDKRPRLEDIPF